VGEVRQLGLVCAVELVEDRATRRGFDWRLRAGYRAYRLALARGVLLRPLGNVLYFLPPYCVTERARAHGRDGPGLRGAGRRGDPRRAPDSLPAAWYPSRKRCLL
jgi:hypothetical protein